VKELFCSPKSNENWAESPKSQTLILDRSSVVSSRIFSWKLIPYD